MTPPAASRPKAEPPDRTNASTCSTIISGSSNAVSRTAGAPPWIAIEATAGSSKMTAVTPVAMRSSSADPTRTPATSVIKLAVIGNPSSVAPCDYRIRFGRRQTPAGRCASRKLEAGNKGGGLPTRRAFERGRSGGLARRSVRTARVPLQAEPRPAARTGWRIGPSPRRPSWLSRWPSSPFGERGAPRVAPLAATRRSPACAGAREAAAFSNARRRRRADPAAGPDGRPDRGRKRREGDPRRRRGRARAADHRRSAGARRAMKAKAAARRIER